MADKVAYAFAGGGTAGHVNPALAVAEAVRARQPQAQCCFFVSRQGMEGEMVRQAGFPTIPVDTAPLPAHKQQYPNFVWKNLRGFTEARQALRKLGVRAVLGTGGYVSAPLLTAARSLHIPAILHEQNAIPGRTNRFLARFCHSLALTFAESETYFQEQKAHGLQLVLTGNPVKTAFFSRDQKSAREELGLAPDTELVLVMGGSLGARSLNAAVAGLPELPDWPKWLAGHPHFQLVLSSGRVNGQDMDFADIPQIRHFDYLDSSLWMPAADLLVGRAGAGFLMESAAVARPMLLVPFPQAADDHQRRNAAAFGKAGAALLLEDSEMDSQHLLNLLRQLLEDPQQQEKMAAAARKLAHPEAAEAIAQLLVQAGQRGQAE